MSRLPIPRSLEGRLAAFALLLGAVAVLGTLQSSETVTLNPRELAAIVESEVDHVTVQELADWIIQDIADVRILDLRPATDYAEYYIPGAENVTLTQLLDYPLYRNERIVLYSGGGIHSAQAWFLLRAHGYQGVYILLGGLNSWKDEVLFPSPPTDPTPERLADFSRASSVATFFGGTPQVASTGGPATQTLVQMPKVAPPTAAPVQGGRKRKAKEGC